MACPVDQSLPVGTQKGTAWSGSRIAAVGSADTLGANTVRDEPDRPRGVTLRATLLGIGLVGVLAFLIPYASNPNGRPGFDLGAGVVPDAAVLALLVVMGPIGGLLLWIRPRSRLTGAEVLTIYAIVAGTAAIASEGYAAHLTTMLTASQYMAHPWNRWGVLIGPHIAPWMQFSDTQAIQWLWEGAPIGAPVPWIPWVVPLAGWCAIALLIYCGLFCLMSLLRRDWIERQRLTFPLVDVPLAIAGDEARPSLKDSILNNRVFWIGFAIPALFVTLGWFHVLFPSVPSPQLYSIEVNRYFAGMPLPWSVLSGDDGIKVSIIFPVIGISCLLPAEVSLSLWVFYLLFQVQMLTWASFGVAESGGTAAIAINPRNFISFQEAGGFLALTAVTIWQSRRALRAAWLSLIGRAREEDDPYAAMAGRSALLIFAAANGFMFWWAARAGMSWWSFAAILGVFYAVLVGASRLVAAGGVMYVDTGFFPKGLLLHTIGAIPIRPAALTMYTYLSVIFMYDPMNLALPQMMNSFKLVHSARLRGRVFSAATFVAIAVIFAVGIPALLKVIYARGATALPNWPFTSYPQWGFGELDATLRVPEPANNWLRLAVVLGAGFTLLLVWLHTQFVWWPVSPVGFLIASSYETNRSLWVNVFIAWALTTAIRRYGGLRLFRSFRPAFLGLVLGQYLPSGVFAILSSIFGITQAAG